MEYEVNIARFSGPLDLLLHLIEEAEIDIKDIFVSEITSQYLAYMERMDGLDMDRITEFLTMAATLLYIKSRQLLPRPPKEEAEEDPELVLIRQLREYKAFREAAEGLRTVYDEAQGGLTRLPEDVPLPPKTVELGGATMDGLYDAFLAILARAEANRPDEEKRSLHNVRPDTYTVRDQIGRIRTVLVRRETVEFTELFEPGASRMEMIVTFMALLEMLHHGEITLRQSAPFAPIRIHAGTLGEDDEAYRYMDETDE